MLRVRPVGERLEVVPDEAAWRTYLESLAPALAVEPVDARFHFDEPTAQLVPIAPSVEGRALDVEASLQNVLHALEAGQHAAPLVLRIVPPRYPDTATAEELGIRELVAEGDSYFIGSPSGRDHNIRLAASKFDGIVIPPGGIFSFNHYLGEVSAEAGYDEAYITAGEQLAIEVGGGICQVSTTAFRAAFFAGLPVTERHPHSYQLRYYRPVGLDATIYQPWRDLKFLNDTPGDVLVLAQVRGHKLYVRLFGTADRSVEWEGPFVRDRKPPLEPREVVDETLEPGHREQIDWAAEGLTAVVRRKVYYGDGRVYEDVFESVYRPWGDVFLVGPPGLEPAVPLPPIIGEPEVQGAGPPPRP